MICLMHNRRKYTQEQVAPVTGGVWADFDLSKTQGHVASKQIVDNVAFYNSNNPLMCYGLSPTPSGGLLIVANSQRAAYVWDFASDHSFELEYLNSFYTSRAGSYADLYSLILNPDGSAYYRCSSSSQNLYMNPLGQNYNLSTSGSGVTILDSTNCGVLATLHYIAFSSDGKKFFYKSNSSAYVYCVSLDTAWPTSAYTGSWSLSRIALSQFDQYVSGSTNTWRGFTFSPDGKCVLFTANRRVAKFVLTTAWDISTLTFHSDIDLYDDIRSVTGDSSVSVTLAGVAVNAAGTKMIVHNRAGDTIAKARFFEYNLVT